MPLSYFDEFGMKTADFQSKQCRSEGFLLKFGHLSIFVL